MKYRKRPIIIEALQWDGTRKGVEDIRAWAPDLETRSLVTNQLGDVTEWRIATMEGGFVVSKFDFVIRGIAGEYYACAPSIFRATYDAVTDQPQQP